jgi:hypothetical protein
MFSDDYLIRMIRQGTAVLARIIGLKKAGDYQEALQEVDQSLEQILGLDVELIRLLDDESLYRILTKNEQLDLDQLGLLADLFKEEGDILDLQDQKPESNNCYIRSLNYYLMMSINQDPSHPIELSQKIKEIILILGDCDLPNETLFNLFSYFENIGEYANADNILTKLATRSEVKSDVRSEMSSFYHRLLEMNPEGLEAGGLSLQQIKSKLKDIE